jgi:surface-anchored protein
MLTKKILSHALAGVCVLALAVGAAGSADAATVEYASGHSDIGIGYEGGNELFLHYHFGTSAVLNGTTSGGDVYDGTPFAAGEDAEIEPSEIYTRIGDGAAGTVPLAPSFDFLGPDGSPVWVLPTTDTAGLPFMGFAAEELDPGTFSSPEFALSGFSGPGDFSLWSIDGGTGTVTVNMDTEAGVIQSTPNSLGLAAGTHSHWNIGFTEEGVYDVELTASATHNTLGLLTDTETFRFVVGSATAVPEPSSLSLLAVIGGAATLRRRRRKQ